jgi:hypothetical protein
MAVTKHASEHSSYGGACNTPTVADGDVLVAHVIEFYTNAGTITPPAADGWSLFAAGAAPTGLTWAVFSKVVTSAAGESATKTFTVDGAGGDQVTVLTSLSGADTTAPIQAGYQTDNADDADAVYNFSSLTIDRGGSLELVFGADYGGGDALYTGGTAIAVGALTSYETGGLPSEQAAWSLAPADGSALTITRNNASWPGAFVRVVVQPPAGGGGGNKSAPTESASRRTVRANPIFRM